MSGQDLMSALQNSINLLNAAQREYRARGVAESAGGKRLPNRLVKENAD